jgi:hypothetical protein
VGAHRLDADLQSKGDLRVGAALPDQQEHVALAPRQQRIPGRRTVVGAARHELQTT